MIIGTIATVFACDVVSFTVIQTGKSYIAQHSDKVGALRTKLEDKATFVVAAAHVIKERIRK